MRFQENDELRERLYGQGKAHLVDVILGLKDCVIAMDQRYVRDLVCARAALARMRYRLANEPHKTFNPDEALEIIDTGLRFQCDIAAIDGIDIDKIHTADISRDRNRDVDRAMFVVAEHEKYSEKEQL